VIQFAQRTGTWNFSIAPIPGFRITNGSYLGSVTSTHTTVTTHWARVTYTVKFEEKGLPSGTEWKVKIDGKMKATNGSAVSFDLPNGTDAFTVSASGYAATSTPPSPLTIDGSSVTVKVTFTPS
jgi:hypothetical protein